MTLYRIDCDAPDLDSARSIEGAFSELIAPVALAVTLFETAGGAGQKVSAYYDTPPNLPELRTALSNFLSGAVLKLATAGLIASDVPEENWVALSQAALPPVTAGRFTVHGSHDRFRVSMGPNAIEIDAGEAFGTAHHATTLGCLMAIDTETRRRKFQHVLDLGCGSGVLAIAAARVQPHARVIASDIDPRATAVARENVRKNRLPAGRIAVVTADALAHRSLRARRYDLIVANILANPLIALACELAKMSPRRGIVILSGLLVPQAPQVSAAYRAAGFSLARHRRIAGWSTLTLVRR